MSEAETTLLAWPSFAEMRWDHIVALAALPGDRAAMAFRSVVKPLLDRGLIELVFAGMYHAETDEYECARYQMTALGAEVVAAILTEPAPGGGS